MKRAWWHDKIAYQIYPKSFFDANGDGIGDLKGIIEKLDYLKELGVDIVWISPVYLSPCADQGYDIADYYQIDPMFGTMEDMDLLLAEAKKRDMGILMDLVVNHCSDEHEWFQKAIEDPDGEFGEFFYITKEGEGIPTNWRSYFGGSVWEKLPGHDRYYLHYFHKKQPDLNWENPRLRQEIIKMVNRWLDKGLAGFRIDAIINIKKPLPFCSYEADREDGMCDMATVLAHANGIGEFLGELRDEAFSPHNALTVGEVFNVKEEELRDFIGENGYFSSMFDFAQTIEGKSVLGWHACSAPTPDQYKKCCFASQKSVGDWGYLSLIIENHDEPRGVSHYLPEDAQHDAGKKLLATMYFLLRGLPFIYQGQELGMSNGTWTEIEEIDDVSSHAEYLRCMEAGLTKEEAMCVVSHYSRDNGRTPFHWSAEPAAGFTKGTPWLAINPNYQEINLEQQRTDETSIFHYYQRLIALRKDGTLKNLWMDGDVIPVWEAEENVMAYLRKGEEQCVLVIGNFSGLERTVWYETASEMYFMMREDAPQATVLLDNLHESGKEAVQSRGIKLKPYQALVIQL